MTDVIKNDYELDDGDFYNSDLITGATGAIAPPVEPPTGENVEIKGPKEIVTAALNMDLEGDGEPVFETTPDGLGDMIPEEEPGSLSTPSDLGSLELDESDSDSEGGEALYTPEERMSILADTLLSACFKKGDLRIFALDTLLALPSPTIFKNENYVLTSVLYAYKNRIRRISIDEEMIRMFLNRSRKIILDGTDYLDINAYGEIDGSNVLGYIGGTLKHYRRLLTLPDIDEGEFSLSMEKYLIEFKSLEAERAYQHARLILTEGATRGRKRLFGFDDSQNYLKRRLAEIEGLVNVSSGTGFTTHREMLQQEKSVKKSLKVADFGRLEPLNKVYGGVYTGMFYEIIAPPKAGKSKFTTKIAHIAAVEYGTNITVWAPEGGNDAFLAQLRAIHFDYMYNSGADVTEKKYGVSQEVIFHDRFPSEDLRSMEASSKLDLAVNPEYGTIDFIDKPFEVETFLEDIDTSVKSNNSKIIFIDYLQMITSARMDERSAVSLAYKTMLAYCRLNNVSVFSPAQYKQETFDKLAESKTGSGIDLRTSGGVSSEVIRTPDIFFALWATTEDLANNTMKILSMPGRFCKPFPDIPVLTNLEVCQFIAVDE